MNTSVQIFDGQPTEPKPKSVPRTIGHLAILIIVTLAIFILSAVIAGLLAPVLGPIFGIKEANSYPAVAYQLIVFFGLMIILCLAYNRFVRKKRPADIGLNGNAFGRFGRGFLYGIAMQLLTVAVIYVSGGYEIDISNSALLNIPELGLAVIMPPVILLIGFLIQGSSEEVLMRGWLMQEVAERHGVKLAIIFNTIVFSLLHGFNIPVGPVLFLGLVNIALVAIFFSFYALNERSIWGVCGWHAAWNWLMGVGLGLKVSGQDTLDMPMFVDINTNPASQWWISGGDFGPEASVAATLVIGIATIVSGRKWLQERAT